MKSKIYKDAIAKSFMELSKEKSVAEITVSDIAKACGISRQTFYHHFKDKFSVMEYLYEPAIRQIKEINMGYGNDIQEALLRMYQECYDNRAYYMSIVSYEGQNSFEEYCMKGNREFFIEYFAQKNGNRILDKSLEIAIDFSCYGAAFTLISWIRNGMKESPEFIAREMYKCLPEILRLSMEESP